MCLNVIMSSSGLALNNDFLCSDDCLDVILLLAHKFTSVLAACMVQYFRSDIDETTQVTFCKLCRLHSCTFVVHCRMAYGTCCDRFLTSALEVATVCSTSSSQACIGFVTILLVGTFYGTYTVWCVAY